jgi:hypothetical protein
MDWKNYKSRFIGIVYWNNIVATQFLTHVLINFQKKSKNSEKHWKPKKYIFNTFASFLAFSASSKKNLNFQRSFERVQLLTIIDFPHWVDVDIARFQKYKKIKKNQIYKKKKVKESILRPKQYFAYA